MSESNNAIANLGDLLVATSVITKGTCEKEIVNIGRVGKVLFGETRCEVVVGLLNAVE